MSHEMTAEWLTHSLQGSLGVDATVDRFTATSIGTGQVGENVRFELDWRELDPKLPRTVVGKFPSSSPVSRAAAVQMSTYVKEVGFYRYLQHRVTISTPRVHAVEWNAATHDFVVLMDDVRPARAGDQLVGCSSEQARLAVDQAVDLHAPTWGRTDELASHEWLGGPRGDEHVAFRTQLFALLTPGFLDRFSSRLSPDVTSLAAPLGAAFPAWSSAVAAWADAHDGWCVVHGDYRLDNFLFGDPPASAPLTVVDWQTVSIGIGPSDVAYCCGAGLVPDVRAAVERGLVERYAAGLRTAGIDITDDDAWHGYVLGSATGYYMAVLASQVVEQTTRGRRDVRGDGGATRRSDPHGRSPRRARDQLSPRAWSSAFVIGQVPVLVLEIVVWVIDVAGSWTDRHEMPASQPSTKTGVPVGCSQNPSP